MFLAGLIGFLILCEFVFGLIIIAQLYNVYIADDLYWTRTLEKAIPLFCYGLVALIITYAVYRKIKKRS